MANPNTNVCFQILQDDCITLGYKFVDNDWMLYGQETTEFEISKNIPIKINMLFKEKGGDENNITEEDVTPEELNNPICFFNENGKLIKNGAKLIAGQHYRSYKTANWQENYYLISDCNQKIKENSFKSPDANELYVVDKNSIFFSFPVRSPTTLSLEFDDSDLVPYVPGKRTFFNLPVLSIRSITGLDSISLRNLNTTQEYVNNSVEIVNDLLDLQNVFEEFEDFGVFELTLHLGNRQAVRRFSVLPQDFNTNIQEPLAVANTSEIYFESSKIAKNVSINISPSQTEIETIINFSNGWSLPIKASIKRQGAYLRIGGKSLAMVHGMTVDTGDLYDNGEIFVNGVPGTAASLCFYPNNVGDKHYLGKKVPKSGVAVFSLKNTSDVFGGGFNFKFLTRCFKFSIRLLTRDGQKQKLGEDVGLLHYSSEQPSSWWDDDDLIVKLKISEFNFVKVPYVALLPVTKQHEPKIPVVAPPDTSLLDWADRLETCIYWEKTPNEPDYYQGRIQGLSKHLSEPAYIIFVMADKFRISGGRFIKNEHIPNTDIDDSVGQAYLNALENPGQLESLFNENIIDTDQINGLVENAKRLNAEEFLHSISSIRDDVVSGFIFRNFRYWFPLMLSVEAGKIPSSLEIFQKQISLFNRFWNLELFSYNDFFTLRKEKKCPELNNSSLDPISILKSQTLPDSSWCIYALNDLSYVEEFKKLLEIIKQNHQGAHSESEQLGKRLHDWRKNPKLGKELNILKNRLMDFKDNDKLSVFYPHIISYAILALLNDQEYIDTFIKEVNS